MKRHFFMLFPPANVDVTQTHKKGSREEKITTNDIIHSITSGKIHDIKWYFFFFHFEITALFHWIIPIPINFCNFRCDSTEVDLNNVVLFFPQCHCFLFYMQQKNRFCRCTADEQRNELVNRMTKTEECANFWRA